MPLFRRQTPEKTSEQKAEKTPEQKAAEESELQLRRQLEETRKAILAERDAKIEAAMLAIETFYSTQAPKWQYKILHRRRPILGRSGDYVNTGGWDLLNIETTLQTLGDEGWELVAAWPLSGVGGFIYAGLGPDVGGVTTEEMWIFKRPKPQLPEKLINDLRDAETYGQDQLTSKIGTQVLSPTTSSDTKVATEDIKSIMEQTERLIVTKGMDVAVAFYRTKTGLSRDLAIQAVENIRQGLIRRGLI